MVTSNNLLLKEVHIKEICLQSYVITFKLKYYRIVDRIFKGKVYFLGIFR